MRVGLIRNPHSQRNRRTGDRLSEVVVPAGVELIRLDPTSADDVPQVVAEYAGRGLTHLIVDGGDGTLRDVMTALPAAFPEALPTLMLMAGGNANLATHDLGGAAHGPDAMQRLLDALATGHGEIRERQPIRTRWPDNDRRPVLGFFVGAAAFYKGWKLALGAVHDKGFMHGPALFVTMAGALIQTLAGGPRNDWQSGAALGLGVDGRAVAERQRFLFLATSLHQLFSGLWPFWDHGDAPLRWLDIDAPPPRFTRSLPGLLRGRPNAWMRQSGAYRSGGAKRIALRLEAPLVIDGEAYTQGPFGEVELAAGPVLRFFSVPPG
jgi:hypothetical protein